MKSLLVLPHVKVQGANAISGLVYGFPAITQILGFTHSLSRDLKKAFKGCVIVCHQHQLHTHPISWGDSVFSLSRNPLTSKGETAPFNEEGRIDLDISLLIECDFTCVDLDFGQGDDDENKRAFELEVYKQAFKKRLAGGIITSMNPPQFYVLSEDGAVRAKSVRGYLRKLLPGFVLCDRSSEFKKHQEENLNIAQLDAYLDFYALRSRCVSSSDKEKAEWEFLPKPTAGWIVPIQVGFRAISSLFERGVVHRARDPNVPFRFVEPVYGIGEWMGIHRVQDVKDVMWRYQVKNEFYLCVN